MTVWGVSSKSTRLSRSQEYLLRCFREISREYIGGRSEAAGKGIGRWSGSMGDEQTVRWTRAVGNVTARTRPR